jgi:hypothetical protein
MEVTIKVNVETAMNLKGLIHNRYAEESRAIKENPSLRKHLKMAHSTRLGYLSVVRQINQQVPEEVNTDDAKFGVLDR